MNSTAVVSAIVTEQRANTGRVRLRNNAFRTIKTNADAGKRKAQRRSQRYRAKTEDKQGMTTKRKTISKEETIRRLRLNDHGRYLRNRYGYELPDADDGREDLY